MNEFRLIRQVQQETASDIPAMLTYKEAADQLKVTKRTIRRRVAAGRYMAYGDGSGKRILCESVLADIERNSNGAR
jgi:excisionase family DNA binding protein